MNFFLSAPLQESNGIKVRGSGKGIRMNRLNDIQKMITDLVERNKERYGLKNVSALVNSTIGGQIGNNSGPAPNNLQPGQVANSQSKAPEDHQMLKANESSDDELLSPRIITPSTNKASSEQCVVLEVDDGDDADIISLMIDSEVPSNFEICNTDQLPGNQPFLSIYTSFSKVFRAKITTAKQFTAQFDYLIQSLFVKLRRLTPCALAGLRFKVDASNEADIIQITMIGTVVGIRTLNDSLVCRNGLSLYLPTYVYQGKKSRFSNADGELVFDNDEEACEKIEIPSTISSVFELSNRGGSNHTINTHNGKQNFDLINLFFFSRKSCLRRAHNPELHTEMSDHQVHRKPDVSVYPRSYQHPRVQWTERIPDQLLERSTSYGSNAHRRFGWQRTGRHEHHAAGADA